LHEIRRAGADEEITNRDRRETTKKHHRRFGKEALMIRAARLVLVSALMCALPHPAAARDPGRESYMIRVIACEGPDAKMEVYVPQSVATGDAALTRALARPVIGFYTLDLTAANKGKVLEPVKVSLTADKQAVIVYQYTRKLPATRIPVSGGTVDFDRRFGTGAKCGPFRAQE
jgi:hypothetical protein